MTSKVKPTSFADEMNELRARDAFDNGIGTACVGRLRRHSTKSTNMSAFTFSQKLIHVLIMTPEFMFVTS